MATTGIQSSALYSGSSATDQTASAARTSTSAASGSGKSNQTLDMNAFLEMFMTQLKYQDPTNPLESYELASQLAQFSTVEQLTTLNNSVSDQQDLLLSINYGQMVNMVGKEVVGLDNSLQLKEGQTNRGAYRLDTSAAEVTVKITDSQGGVVRTMTLGAKTAGQYDLEWDGRNDAGETMPDGTYKFTVMAEDNGGNSIDVTEMVIDKVYAFRFDSGSPYLILGGEDGIKLPIGAVLEVHEAPAA